MKKLLICLIIIFSLMFTISCGNDKTDVTTSKNESTVFTTGSTGTTNQETDSQTNIPFATDENDRGLLDLYTIKKAAELYAEAANKVKNDSAGFTCSEWQDLSNIQTADKTGIADRVLKIVSDNLFTNETDAFGSQAITIPKGSVNRINLMFPVYNKTYGCVLEDKYDCIKSAEYDKKDGQYKITLHFADVLNAEEDTPGFGQIMTPFVRSEILDAIETYVFIADLSSLALDFLYRDCYLSCVIDAKTMQMISMEQHIKAYISASAEVKVLGFTTDFLNGTATIENHLHYYNFDW